MKVSYVSPNEGTLSVMVKSQERPEALITLDLCIPVWPVWNIRVPMDPYDGAAILDLAVQALAEDVLNFLLVMEFQEKEAQMIFAKILSAYETIKASDTKEDADGGALLYETTFSIEQEFVDATHESIVTAASRSKEVSRPVKKMQVIQTIQRGKALPEAKQIIQKYRNRALKGQPRPMYLLVYDYNGRPVGVQRL